MLIPYYLGTLEEEFRLPLDWFFDPVNIQQVTFDQELWTPEEFATPSMFDILSTSSHSFCNARSVAKIYSVFANHGKYGANKQLFSEETFQKMIHISEGSDLRDFYLHMNTTMVDGGWARNVQYLFVPIGGNWYGWPGWGGQFGFFNPMENVSYGFFRTGHTLFAIHERDTNLFTGAFGLEYKIKYPSKE